jgi:ferredoxin
MLRLYYFSGTGNARSVATWIATVWRAYGREAELVDLARIEPRRIHIDAEDEVGILSPTHGFNLPPITLSFLAALPRAPKANRVFVVNTRAGVRLFGVCLPGLSGVAQIAAASILAMKGYRVVGMRPIDLPSNWISLHPGLREDNIRVLHERCAKITQRFAERMLRGQRDFRALWDLPIDLLIAPISLGYYCVGRFLFAKSFVATRDCDRCGRCVKQCPVKALEWVDQRPFWTWRCESCMRCMNHCPKRAIETAHGFIIALPILFSLALSWVVAKVLPNWLPAWALRIYRIELVSMVVEPALMLAFVFVAYRILHRAMQVSLIERAVVATSLTHFDFWRRYRPTREQVSAAGTKAALEIPREDAEAATAHVVERR